MPGKAGTLEILAQQVGLALQPLQSQLKSDNVIRFLAQLGLQFPQQLLQPNFVNSLNVAATAAGALPTTLSQLATDITDDDELGIVTDGLKLIQEISSLISTLPQIGAELKNISGTIPGMNSAEITTFAQNLPANILSYALISYLEGTQPGVVAILNLLGVVSYAPNPGVAGDSTHPPFTARKLQLSNLSNMLKSPSALLQTIFLWGAPGFDGTVLIPAMSASFNLLEFYSTVTSTAAPAAMTSALLDIQANPSTNPPGLSATLKDDLPAGFNLTLPLSSLCSVRMQVNGTFAAGLTATIVPPSNVNLKPPTGTLNGLLEMELVAKGADSDHPIILIGQTGGSRIEAKSFTFSVKMTANWDAGSGTAVAEPSIAVRLAGGKAVIDTSNADGFLATVLSGIHVESGFDFSFTWAPDAGIHFDGGAQLELDLPLHLELGPIKISTLYLVAGASPGGIPLELSVALGLSLGPFKIVVDRLGATGLFSFPASGGNLGPANLTTAFKPPNGLGVSIDAGVVAGGGFISFFPDKGQYNGVFEVEIVEIIHVKVIAILDTVLPDGSKGFSFLLIVTFDMPPIQLSFGFTLNGVGGLFGVNRTMAVDQLHAGLRAHTLNSVLFPPDPIANAPQIVSNVRSFFPPANGRFVFGPMLKLGWGTPTLITLAVGAILEVPDPVRLAIIGLVDVGLPTEDIALVALHVDVLGTIDFGVKKLSIDGSMYDSHVLIYSISGDLAFRLSWGSDPNFVFSLGGFNPHFNTAGLDVPQLNRLSVSIGVGDNPRLSSNSYFAITSNSLQFGANTELYASAAGFTVRGYLGFDVLIIFSPFFFEFDFQASFDISFEDVSLAGFDIDGTVSGPTPWHVHAHASFHILFVSVSASFTIEWGESTPAKIDKKKVLPDLIAALQDPRNWSTQLPDGTKQTVSLVSPNSASAVLRVHPMGALSVRENIVPLDLTISHYGNAAPDDGNIFAISAVSINGQAETKQNFQDYFATGQFLNLSDADKLSRPGFERYDAGIRIGSDTIVHGPDSPRTVTYEERYVDVPTLPSRFGRRYLMPADIHSALTRQGAGYLSQARATGLGKYTDGPAVAAISASDPVYVVAHVETLAVHPEISNASGATYFQTRAALSAHLALHPGDTPNLQIVPLHEVGV
jgi:hypothetical protein